MGGQAEVWGTERGVGSTFTRIGRGSPSGELCKRTAHAQLYFFVPVHLELWTGTHCHWVEYREGIFVEKLTRTQGLVQKTKLSRYFKQKGISYRELDAYVMLERLEEWESGPSTRTHHWHNYIYEAGGQTLELQVCLSTTLLVCRNNLHLPSYFVSVSNLVLANSYSEPCL